MEDITTVRSALLKKLETLRDKRAILRAPELKKLYSLIKDQPADKKVAYGQAVNELKKNLKKKPQSSVLNPQLSVRLM